jgi:cephalosporin-C deacetylase-like acetyl esterase
MKNSEEFKRRNGYSHMVLDYYVERVKERREERNRRLGEIKNRKQAEHYREYVRGAIRKAFSPLPDRTPLNPLVTGVMERPGYRMEKVIFESRPNCFVTGNLYIPEKIDKPCPGVLGTCGHSGNGKAELRYQEFCQRLVKAGFVVFIYDPINQGERDQYFLFDKELAVQKGCCWAHNMMGKQMQLIGEWFGIWRLWDGIRALDYLLSRSEVDKSRVGLTGNSGGGTMTTWLRSMDDRFTMSAPSCFVTTFLANLENELPADAEQCPPRVIKEGLEHADFLIAAAPKPVILLGQQYDFFDRRGLREAYKDIKRFYGFFSAERNVELFIGDKIHGYYPENQENMVRFFCKHAGIEQSKSRFVFKGEKDQNLWATKKGNVVAEGSVPVYEMISEKAANLARMRRKRRLSDIELKQRLKKILNIPAVLKVPHYRVLSCEKSGDILINRYAVETERNIRAIVRKKLEGKEHIPTLDVEKRVSVYLPDASAEEEMSSDGFAAELMKKYPLYAIDVRGTGESRPDEKGSFFNSYGMDYMMHSYGLMLGENYLGRRVFDVLQVLKLLKSEGAEEIYLYGRRQGAILALFTAVLDDGIKKVFLKELPESFLSLTQMPVVDLPAASFPFGILKEFDIPDCLKALGKRYSLK